MAPIAQERSPAPSCPLGRLALADARKPRTSSSDSPACVQGRRVDVDADRRQGSPAHEDPAHALDLRDLLLQHRGRDVVDDALVHHVRDQGEQQDRRVRGVDLAVAGIRGKVRGQLPPRGVDRGLHVARRGVDVSAEVELEHDLRLAERARRGHLGDPGDPAELALERCRDRGRHRLGARARQVRRDLDRRELDLRQRRHRQKEVGHAAGEGDGDRQEGRPDRPPDEGVGDAHRTSDETVAAAAPARGARRPETRRARRSKAR